jgi:hypothetical protein
MFGGWEEELKLKNEAQRKLKLKESAVEGEWQTK